MNHAPLCLFCRWGWVTGYAISPNHWFSSFSWHWFVIGVFFSAYTQSFIQNVTPNAQCIAWNSFVSQLDPTRSYSSITISGTASSDIFQLNVGLDATRIVQALHRGNTSPWVSVGNLSWIANYCGTGIEVNSPNLWICSCGLSSFRNALYPCAYMDDWGGLNSSLCYSPSQTIILTIQ